MDSVSLSAPRHVGTGIGSSVACTVVAGVGYSSPGAPTSDVGTSLLWPVVDCRLSQSTARLDPNGGLSPASTDTPPAPAGSVFESICSTIERQDELGGPHSDVFRHRVSPVVPSTAPPIITGTSRVEPHVYAAVSKTTVNVLRHRRRPEPCTGIDGTASCNADFETEVQQIDAVRFYDPPAF